MIFLGFKLAFKKLSCGELAWLLPYKELPRTEESARYGQWQDVILIKTNSAATSWKGTNKSLLSVIQQLKELNVNWCRCPPKIEELGGGSKRNHGGATSRCRNVF